jgi:hypothetical protein
VARRAHRPRFRLPKINSKPQMRSITDKPRDRAQINWSGSG